MSGSCSCTEISVLNRTHKLHQLYRQFYILCNTNKGYSVVNESVLHHLNTSNVTTKKSFKYLLASVHEIKGHADKKKN